MSHLPSIRKAAILVASLDVDSADLLLAQMTDEQADEVRRAVLELGEPDPSEQQAVLDEFFRIGPLTLAAAQEPKLEDHLQAGLRQDIDEYISPASNQFRYLLSHELDRPIRAFGGGQDEHSRRSRT
jgi:hypothetical protein